MIPGTRKRESRAVFLDNEEKRENSGAIHGNPSYAPLCHASAYTEEDYIDQQRGFGIEGGVRQGTTQSVWIHQIEKAVQKCCRHFLESQHEEGYWCAELESNVTITSEYIMLLYLLGIVNPEVQKSAVKYLYNEQLANGAWGLYYGDEGNLSITVEAYFALKLAGEDPADERLRKARDFILHQGGVESSRVFTKVWLALFGQYDWHEIPTMPVELMLLPEHFYFNIYEFSMWARGTAVPVSIVMALRPQFDLPSEKTIPELFVGDKPSLFPPTTTITYTHRIFSLIDRLAKLYEKYPVRSLRERAIRAAEAWTLERQEESGDWGGIQPPMVYSVLAFHYLGYSLDHPAMVKGLKALENFCLEDEHGFRMQSCVSPLWDTALTALAMLDAGVPADHPSLRKVTRWLVKNQIKTGGDWQIKTCCPPGGWAFEFVNTHYPDVDDSAVILYALHRLSDWECEGLECCRDSGMQWCLSMQSSCGGWAAFDRDNTMMILNRIPFADQEAMVDYPTADVTARMLEAMGFYGYPKSHPRARLALQFLHDLQEDDGCWWGRWGVNYIYGTWSVLRGLVSIGEDPGAAYIQAALSWLKEHQNPDGGWGETCETYARPELRGQGPSTASQTAWAVMGLLAGGEEESPEVQRGIQYLLRNQKPDGTWDELYFTGTGFPNHFYIRYHNYRNCFPLMALGQYLRTQIGLPLFASANGSGQTAVPLQR